MPRSRFLFCLLLAIVCVAHTSAQQDKREPLSDSQIEEIREAGIDPDLRISLYTKYLNERAETIKGLTNRAKSNARAKRIDDELQDFTALMDELGSNLDQYSERKADMRKSLKSLNDDCPKWHTILTALAGEPTFDISRKEAIESNEDLTDRAKRLLADQTAYFLIHKDEKGQQRVEPR